MDLLKKTDYNTNINDIKGKIPCITYSATAAAFNVVDNKIPYIRHLVKKTD